MPCPREGEGPTGTLWGQLRFYTSASTELHRGPGRLSLFQDPSPPARVELEHRLQHHGAPRPSLPKQAWRVRVRLEWAQPRRLWASQAEERAEDKGLRPGTPMSSLQSLSF